MTDETPAAPETQPTTPLPAAGEPAAASAPPPVAPGPAPSPTPAPAKSPWPVLIPVLVGVGALLIGGIVGGSAGFAIGHRFDRGPALEYRMPDLPRFDGGPQDRRDGPNRQDGDGQNQQLGPFDRSDVVTGTIKGLSDGKLTVELKNGDVVTLSVADDTPVVEANSSSVSELATGDDVTVLVQGRNGDREARLIRTGDGSLSDLVAPSR